MNKLKNLILISVLFLTACAENPYETRSEEDSTVSDTINESGYVQIPSNTNEKIGNITFACEPDPINAEDFYVMRSPRYYLDSEIRPELPKKDYAGDIEKLKASVHELFGFDIPDDRILVHGLRGTGSPVKIRNDAIIEFTGYTDQEYYSENMILAQLYDKNNSFDFYDFRNVTGEWPNRYLERKVYYPDNIPDTEYEMVDGSKMNISESINRADEIIKKVYELKLLDEEIALKLNKIGVHTTDIGKTVINLRYRQIIEGLPVNDDGTNLFNDIGDSMTKFTYFDISFSGNEYPMFIRNVMSTSIESKEKLNTVMNYQEAQEKLAKGLAPNLEFTVTEAGLRYCCIYDNVSEYDELRPMWVFVLEDPTFDDEKLTMDDMENIDKANPFQYYPRTVGYVDAVNGDIYYLNCENKVFSQG